MATSRRNALKGGLSLLGAAAGVAAVRDTSELAPIADAPLELAGSQRVVHGRRWSISSQDLRRGELPHAGVRMLTRGEIFDTPTGGRKVGDFFATYHRLSTPGKVALHEPGSLELHTFVFADGTIVGSGVASASIESEGHFAIVGGTGRYVGVKGAYAARQSFAELGGAGAAVFTFLFV